MFAVNQEVNADKLCQQFTANCDRLLTKYDKFYSTRCLIQKVKSTLPYLQEKAKQHEFNGIQANGYYTVLRTWSRMFKLAASGTISYEVFANLIRLIAKEIDNLQSLANILDMKSDESQKVAMAKLFIKTFQEHKRSDIELAYDYNLIGVNYSNWTRRVLRSVASGGALLISIRQNILEKIKLVAHYISAQDIIAGFHYKSDIVKLDTVAKLLDMQAVRYPMQIRNYFKFFHTKLVRRTVRAIGSRKYTFQLIDNGIKLARLVGHGEKFDLKCRLIRNDSYGKTNKYHGKVLIYLHGLAFIGPSVEFHEDAYLLDLASKLPGTTILALDYRVGHDAPFPAAHQNCLDFYIWLTSRTIEVSKLIGFQPVDISLFGESSGGQLATSLVVALNDLKRSYSPDLVMPRNLICAIPKLALHHNLYPSHTMFKFDALMNTSIMSAAAKLIIPIKSANSISNSKDADVRKFFTKQFGGEFVESQYLDPGSYQHHKDLSDITLSLILVKSCPFLDEGLELANRWQGKVNVNVLDGVFHPYLGFGAILPDAQKATDFTAKVVRDALS